MSAPVTTATSRPSVLFVATEFPFPARNGITNKTSHYLAWLGEMADVTLVAFTSPGDQPTATAREEADRHCVATHVVEQQPRRSAAAAGRLAPPFVTRYRTDAALALVRRLTSERTFDLVHLDCHGSVALGDAIVRRPRRLVASPNDVYGLMLEGRPRAGSPLARVADAANRWLVRRFERRAFAACDQVHFVSRVDCDYLAAAAPAVRTHWVPLGVAVPPTGAPTDGAAEEPATLVFVANMLEIHGAHIVDFVRHTLPLVRRDVPEARLLVVGANPPPGLLDAARDDARITVTGYVPDTHPFLARGALALCLNTLLGGMQTKVLGAMAVGKAVVGLPQNFAAIEGAVDGAHFVSARTRAGLAAAIVELLRDPRRRHAIGHAARALMRERYTWEAVLARYATLALPRSAADVGAPQHGDGGAAVERTAMSRGAS